MTDRVSKSSINDLISIVIGSLPFRLQEIYEAISRKESGNGGGRNEEIGNGKHEKRGGHRWSRMGRRRQSRKWHIAAGINGITLPTTMHPEMMCVLLSGASLTPLSP